MKKAHAFAWAFLCHFYVDVERHGQRTAKARI